MEFGTIFRVSIAIDAIDDSLSTTFYRSRALIPLAYQISCLSFPQLLPSKVHPAARLNAFSSSIESSMLDMS